MIKKINSVARLTLFYICHPRMFLSGVQSRVSGFPIKTFGNDNSFLFGNDTRSTRGQTALVLILLAAAALIFLAISLNWGRISQTKVMVSIAADQAATQMASSTASYGEMLKQTNLKDKNQITFSTGLFLSIIMIVIAVVLLFVPGMQQFSLLLILSIVMNVINIVLQAVVVQPGITALWNKLQKNQPQFQQFYEQGVASALQSSITDQVKIIDYLDWNANGRFGNNSGPSVPNDSVSRFAVFYTERLKMLNKKKPLLPQLAFFYNQLGEFLNGETCFQNETDVMKYPGIIALNPFCLTINPDPQYCVKNPIDPPCQAKIPGVFQLNDACAFSDPSKKDTYSPYCDPCCQPLTDADGKPLRPSASSFPACADQSPVPAQCFINNPYNSPAGANNSPYPFLYDPAFQNYAKGVSFLAQFGRDQQIAAGTPLAFFPMAPDIITPPGAASPVEFPNGVFPFFWLTKSYFLQVDNINPAATLLPGQVHWCAAGGLIPSSGPAPPGFADLGQLTLPYACSGLDCCVNNLADSIVAGVLSSSGNIKLDMAGSPSFTANPYPGGNPGLDSSFAKPGWPSLVSWLEGDNQLCSTTWPYNGTALMNSLDGTCEIGYNPPAPNPTTSPGSQTPVTVDNLDSAMHTLSDFVNFSTILLSHDVGTLNSSLQSWCPRAAEWMAPCENGSSCSNGQCSDGTACGRLLSIYNPYASPPMDLFNQWKDVMTKWLKNTYIDDKAWCVPQETTLKAQSGSCGDGSTCSASGQCADGTLCNAEDIYINNNSGTTAWGDLPHVIACLDYNSSQAVPNYQACLKALTGACPSALPAVCAASTLGRSLAGPNPHNFNGKCDPTVVGSYAKWVNDSYTLAKDEQPKFALRSAYLTDVATRGQALSSIFTQGDTALQSFLKPCGSAPNCADGGPAAQLTYACSAPSPASKFPNSVIYGWQDPLPQVGGGCIDPTGKNKVGCSHIVKVTAYSPGGRGGSFSLKKLPWIKRTVHSFLGIPFEVVYTLKARDGPVYVGIRRWDEDPEKIVNFPNGHVLWQYLYHNPGAPTTLGQGLPPPCIGLNAGTVGFGLEDLTLAGLKYAMTLPAVNKDNTTIPALGEAFMLNGNVDDHAVDPDYASCLDAADQLLSWGTESHACVQYIASRNASGPSGDDDKDYSMKFYSCEAQPEDL